MTFFLLRPQHWTYNWVPLWRAVWKMSNHAFAPTCPGGFLFTNSPLKITFSSFSCRTCKNASFTSNHLSACFCTSRAAIHAGSAQVSLRNFCRVSSMRGDQTTNKIKQRPKTKQNRQRKAQWWRLLDVHARVKQKLGNELLQKATRRAIRNAVRNDCWQRQWHLVYRPV